MRLLRTDQHFRVGLITKTKETTIPMVMRFNDSKVRRLNDGSSALSFCRSILAARWRRVIHGGPLGLALQRRRNPTPPRRRTPEVTPFPCMINTLSPTQRHPVKGHLPDPALSSRSWARCGNRAAGVALAGRTGVSLGNPVESFDNAAEQRIAEADPCLPGVQVES
jgi:hypothetical protein